MIRIRLIRKLALCLDGVDVSRLLVGEVTALPDWQATMLVKEGWAETVAPEDLTEDLTTDDVAVERT